MIDAQLLVRIEERQKSLATDVHDLQKEVKNIRTQLDQGAGGLRVLLYAAGIMATLTAGAAWFGQHFKPFG